MNTYAWDRRVGTGQPLAGDGFVCRLIQIPPVCIAIHTFSVHGKYPVLQTVIKESKKDS